MEKLPIKAFKCVVELSVNEVSAPGVRLANKDDLYLNVCMLGQQRRTRLVLPLFPLKFSDHLIFEKTFKFCRWPLDVIGFLNDLHVLIELIQLGRSEHNEVLAWYETNAKSFLYPSDEEGPIYISSQRDVFMTRSEEFPGTISPQLIFNTTVRIDETQTPSLDILREYENRFVCDPLIEMKKKSNKTKKENSKRSKSPKRGILRNNYQENFANHTISSAIKADFTQPDVKLKLDELNKSVKKTRIVKTAPALARQHTSKPFVVRKVEDYLILRKPELHDVLHDGLVLVKKRDKNRRKNKRIRARSNQSSRSRSNDHRYTSASLENILKSKSYDQATRSLSPQNRNFNLKLENERSSSRSLSNSSSRRNNRTYDILPASDEQFANHHEASENINSSNYVNCSICSNLHQNNCEVCQDYKFRIQPNLKANTTQRNNEFFNKSNSSSIFNKIIKSKDPLNETQISSSEFQVQNHGGGLCKEAHEFFSPSPNPQMNYPKNQSFSHFAPPPSKHKWKYSRYYPWLFNYTEYLRDLEDELYSLKVRSQCLQN